MGAITRNSAGGIATFAAIFFVIPPLLLVRRDAWAGPPDQAEGERDHEAASALGRTSGARPGGGASEPPRERKPQAGAGRRRSPTAAAPARLEDLLALAPVDARAVVLDRVGSDGRRGRSGLGPRPP